jgi:twinkle protein
VNQTAKTSLFDRINPSVYVRTLDGIPWPAHQETYETGFPMLDTQGIRLTRPAFMTVVGPYGSGKSVLVRQLACNMARLHGWRTLVTAFEERVKPRMLRDFRRFFQVHNDDGSICSMAGELSEAEADKVDEQVADSFRFLLRPHNEIMDQRFLMSLIRHAVERHDIKMVIIDPVNEIDHDIPRDMTITRYMGDFIMSLKALAFDYEILVCVVAHPAKMNNLNRNSGYVYTLNDASDTAHFGNKSDFGWCVWRPNGEASTFLNIDKIKDQETCGRPGLYALEMRRQMFVVTDKGKSAIELLKDQTA